MEYEIIPQKGFSFNFKELVQYKELFLFFTWRDIKVKYKQTVIGFLWAVLQPFLTMLIFTFFFGNLAGINPEGIPYPIFAFSGLMYWNIFSSGISNAGNSMVLNANIIKKIYFPRLIIPISCVMVSFFDFIITFFLFLLLLLYFGLSINIFQFILFQALAIITTFVSTAGLGSLLSALNVKYRDFRYIIPFMVQTLMFLTPVIYPISIIKYSWAKTLLSFNPMYAPIEFSRAAIYSNSLNMDSIMLSSLSCVFIFLVGMLYFKRTENYFADIA